MVISDPIDRIKNGDIVQLIHGMSGRALNSHDVAAPVSPQNQEVSCYIDYNISMVAQNLWRVKLLNSDETNGFWHTIHSRVQLIHLNTSQALKVSLFCYFLNFNYFHSNINNSLVENNYPTGGSISTKWSPIRTIIKRTQFGM